MSALAETSFGQAQSPVDRVADTLVRSLNRPNRPTVITVEKAREVAEATLPRVKVSNYVPLFLARDFQETGNFHPEHFGPPRLPVTPPTPEATPPVVSPTHPSASEPSVLSQRNIKRALRVGKVIYHGASLLHRGLQVTQPVRR